MDNFEKYIGIKTINAKPMTSKEYDNIYKENSEEYHENPIDSNKDDLISNDSDKGFEGYVVYDNDTGISWYEKQYFEENYRKLSEMTFGQAFEMVKRGHKVTRKSWNDKDNYLFMINMKVKGEDTRVCIGSKSTSISWFVNQDDILAEDWMVIS